MTLSLTLTPTTSQWLKRRSEELGVSPDRLAADIIERREAAEEFRALSRQMSAEARAQGLTPEKLAELLDGETYE